MVQDATGMWAEPPRPANPAAGSLGPGELPQARTAERPAAHPWQAAAGPDGRVLEHFTGRIVNTTA